MADDCLKATAKSAGMDAMTMRALVLGILISAAAFAAPSPAHAQSCTRQGTDVTCESSPDIGRVIVTTVLEPGERLEIVKLLVAKGADVNARVWVEQVWAGPGVRQPTGEWRTPLNMARRNGQQAVAAYLRSVGAQE